MENSKNIDKYNSDIKKLIPDPPPIISESFDEDINKRLEDNLINMSSRKDIKKKRKLHQIVRVLFTTIYLLNIIISIPISFQIGGIDCGLCFTITIFLIYFSLATFKFVFFNKKSPKLYNNWLRLMYYLQLFYIPPLLMICLSLFDKDNGIRGELSNDTENSDGELNIMLLSKTLVFLHNIILNDIWPIYVHVIDIWRWLILHSTPYFTLLEGIFVILFIQTVGQFYKILKQPYNAVTTKTAPLSSNVLRSNGNSQHKFKKIDNNNNKSSTTSNNTTDSDSTKDSPALKAETLQADIMKTSVSIDLNEEEDSSEDEDDDLRSIASVQDFNYYNNENGEAVYIQKDEEKSSIYNILGLIASSFLITLSIYYLYKIYILPNFTLNAIEATLIGVFFALAVIIGIYGIVSKRGSILESSLLFAYLVRCIYQINPVLSDSAMWDIMEKLNETWQQQMVVLQNNNLNYNIKNFFSSSHHYTPNDNNLLGRFINYTLSKVMFYHKSEDKRNFVDLAAVFVMNILPKSIISVYKISSNLIKQSFTPSVATNLTFRLLVYYSATRIIPTLSSNKFTNKSKDIIGNVTTPSHLSTQSVLLSPKDHNPKLDKEIDELVKDNLSRTPSLQSLQSFAANSSEAVNELDSPNLRETEGSVDNQDNKESDDQGSITELIYVYSPCILIAMYTHLTLQYCKDNGDGNFIEDKLCIWGDECIPSVIKLVLNKFNVTDLDTSGTVHDGIWVDNWAFWNWVNILFYLVLYFFELQN